MPRFGHPNDPASAAVRLEAAAAFAEEVDARWLAAQARYAEGIALKRLGHRTRAAESLGLAAHRFARLGALTWQGQALAQKLAARPSPHDDTTLSAAEQKVAQLASVGRSNREIAAELFITVATVEAHLTRVYRKLGVRSRSGLTGALSLMRHPDHGPGH